MWWRIKPEIFWSPRDFTPCFLLCYLGLAGPFQHCRCILCCLVASSHLQSLILRPPHIFLPRLDVCYPLILFISHALGSSLSSSASCSHLHLLLSLIFLLHYYIFATVPECKPSSLTSNHCYLPQSLIVESLLPKFPPPTWLSTLIMAHPSFYLSIKHNLLSPHSLIIASRYHSYVIWERRYTASCLPSFNRNQAI